MDFAIPRNYKVKIKERKKRDTYLDLARELKKLLSMMVAVMLIVIGMLGTVPKSIESGLENWK